MLTKIVNNIKYGKQRGGFGIQILYPGLIRPDLNDSGFSTIGRIGHARVAPGMLISMHPHKNDEILTYLRSGIIRLLDSEGHTDIISNQRLMMMNACANFYHEEWVLEEGGTLEGLQIFLRPETADLSPQVKFSDLHDTYSVNRWRKIAGKGQDYSLQIRSDTWLMDLRLQKGQKIVFPEVPAESCAFLLYVFDGKVNVNETMDLAIGESVLIEMEDSAFRAVETSDVVLLITQTSAAHFDGGMYSGNLHR